jgi:hypothetical protein
MNPTMKNYPLNARHASAQLPATSLPIASNNHHGETRRLSHGFFFDLIS